MHARVITFQYRPGKVDEGLDILRETVVPELRQLAGYEGALNLVDHSNNKVVGITLWKTEEDLRESGAGKLQARFAKVGPLLAAAPLIENYEVTDKE